MPHRRRVIKLMSVNPANARTSIRVKSREIKGRKIAEVAAWTISRENAARRSSVSISDVSCRIESVPITASAEPTDTPPRNLPTS